MAKEQKLTIRYSISFKQKVVKEIEEEGLSISAVARRYGIKGGSTVNKWLQQFGKNHLLNKIIRVEMKGEKDVLKEQAAEIKQLKIALADATMAKNLLESFIEVANEYYQTDIKKNFGPQRFQRSAKSKGIQ